MLNKKKENLDSNSWKAESQATDKENLNVDLIESCDNHLVNNIIINSSVTSDPSENVFYIKDLVKKLITNEIWNSSWCLHISLKKNLYFPKKNDGVKRIKSNNISINKKMSDAYHKKSKICTEIKIYGEERKTVNYATSVETVKKKASVRKT